MINEAKIGDVRLWVVIPLILMIPLNIGLWYVYVQNQELTATKNEPKIPTLWNYFESDIFKTITASLIIPIFMFLFERRFKIIDNYEKNRTELRKKKQEENREKRWSVILETTNTLKEINTMVSEVRFYVNTNGDINDTLKKITSVSISLSNLINLWSFRFPNLTKKMTSLFADYIIVLYWGAWAVGHSIKYKTNSNIIEEQENLAMIQRGVVSTFIRPFLQILNSSANILDLIETDGTPYLYPKKQEKIIEYIKFSTDSVINKKFNTPEDIYKIISKIINSDNEVKFTQKFTDNKNWSYQVPLEPLQAIWIKCAKDIKNEIKSLLDGLESYLKENQIFLDEENKIELFQELEKLVTSLLELKAYEILLKIDKFKNEEILPGSINSESQESYAFRNEYQNFNKWKNNPDILKTDSKEYNEFLKSDDYLRFMELFYRIPNLTMLTVISNDTIQRMRTIGNTIRFGVIIPFVEENTESVR